ncbi:hypothetical protein [Oceaniglobus ichthyenteri]|uniref:hypothetical protein n=1 Tax=Oceaniglobus ichthyenteri TaxID=2136177 RepID=UPI000D3A8C28|nr:hypothetical protein [Oceaniglobus ichthyenteri]
MANTEQTTRDLKSLWDIADTRIAEMTGTAFYKVPGDTPSEAEIETLVDLRGRIAAALGEAA